MNIDPLLPLIGVALGATMSFAATFWMDRARYLRDERAYWRKERLASYGDFAIATKRYMSILYRVAAFSGVDDQTEHLTMDEARLAMAARFEEREAAFERMRLVGGAEVVEKARVWVRLLYAMRVAVDNPGLTRRVWSEIVGEVNQARDNFHIAVQKEIAGNG